MHGGSFHTPIVILMLACCGINGAIDRRLDFEAPDASLKVIDAKRTQYCEDGECYSEAGGAGLGCGEVDLVSGGRHGGQCLEVFHPPCNTSKESWNNRQEWSFSAWGKEQEYWAGFSIKVAEGKYSTTKLGFFQLKNSGKSKQMMLKFSGRTDGDLLEVEFQTTYGASSLDDRHYLEHNPFWIPQGEWVDFVVHWRIDINQSSSFCEVWMNGARVGDYRGKIGYADCTGKGAVKIGAYGIPDTRDRILLFDEMRFTTANTGSFDEVDPSSGGTPPPPPTQVYDPVFSLAEGTYQGPRLISITCSTDGAAIYYTLDGSEPAPSSTLYDGALLLESSATVTARAWKDGLDASNIVSATYAIEQLPDNRVAVALVTASDHDGNVPENAVDGDLSTRWSAYGEGQWILFDFQDTVTLGSMGLVWYNGDQRSYTFDIQVSADGERWTDVVTGAGSGAGAGEIEWMDLPASRVRYVRLTGRGNSSSDWNSLAEAVFSRDRLLPVSRIAAHARRRIKTPAGAGARYDATGRRVKRGARGAAHGRTNASRVTITRQSGVEHAIIRFDCR